ncbi:MAG: hypothetical protein EOP46_04080 [Sphingobacteriaceae bacterium]|nr:MAG: hypothetical protein EOP46_04080 [Sphingobacteriaceae bacterium]
MKIIKLIVLLSCIWIECMYAQNTATLPSGTIQTTPQYRIKMPADSLRELWVNFPMYGYNKIYTATELNTLFKKQNSISNKVNKQYTDSLHTTVSEHVTSIEGKLTRPFSENFYFTFNGTNNVQPLSFLPEEYGEQVSLNGEILQKGIDYYFTGDSISIRPSNLFSSIEYNVEIKYYIKAFPERTGIISFIFDDGKAEDDSVVLVMDQYGYKCGFALVTNGNQTTYPYNVRKALYLDYQNRGYEILSHSRTHAHFSDTTQLLTARAQFLDSYNQLTNDGFHITGFVTPYNTMYPTLIPLMLQYYRYGYTAPRFDLPNTSSIHYSGHDIHKMARNSVEFSVTAVQIKAHIDSVIAKKGYTCFYAHKLGDIFKTNTFIDVLNYIQSKVNSGQLQILTPGAAMKKFFTYNYQ